MSICTRCGEKLIETPGLSYCPRCLDCFIPSGMIAQDIDEEQTFFRIRTHLTESGSEGRIRILEYEHGTGCTTALRALATHQVLPHALPDFTAFYFDANRPDYRREQDFRRFLLNAVRAYAPRYEEPDTEPSKVCSLLLRALMEQLLLRSVHKQLIIFIMLPEELPADFIRMLPRGRSLPDKTGLFLVCRHGLGDSLQTLLPRADRLPSVLRSDPLHERSVRLLLAKSVFRLTLRQKLTLGDRVTEDALRLTESDYHRVYLLRTLYKDEHAFTPEQLAGIHDLWRFAFRFYAHQWGTQRFSAAVRAAVMLAVWGNPLPPMLLPALCGETPLAIADVFCIPELIRVTRQNDTPVAAFASPEALEMLRGSVPEEFQYAAERLVQLAEGTELLPFPRGGLSQFFCGVANAVARFGTADQLERLFTAVAEERMCSRMAEARANGRMTAEEEEEVWSARCCFAKQHNRPSLHMEACMQRLRLHTDMNLPSAAIEDLGELIRAVQPAFQRRTDGRAVLSGLYEQRAEWAVKACRARAALEDYQRAVRFAEPLPEESPTDEQLHQLAKLLLARGEFEQQHRLYEQMMEDFCRAAELLQAAALPDRELRIQLLLRRGQAYAHQGKDESALADFDQLLQLLPTEADPDVFRLRQQVYEQQGAIYDRQKESLKAAAAYTRLIRQCQALAKQEPQYGVQLSQAYSARAASHEHNGNTDFAYADRCEAIETLTGDDAPPEVPPMVLARAWLMRARLLEQLGRIQDGAADCTQGIRLLEPMISTSSREITLLCMELYQQRDRLYTTLQFSARATEDRRRTAQLQILLRGR